MYIIISNFEKLQDMLRYYKQQRRKIVKSTMNKISGHLTINYLNSGNENFKIITEELFKMPILCRTSFDAPRSEKNIYLG